MARPPKGIDDRRDDRLTLRLAFAERSEIDRNAALLGISPCEFVRRRSLGYRLPESLALQRHEAARNAALLRLGVNLNQMTKHANAGRGVPDALTDIIARINAALDASYDPR